MNILSNLRDLWFKRRAEIDKLYNRTLPFGDYVVDRWEKARELGFGDGSSVYDSSIIFGNVEVGENTWIGPFTILDGSGGLMIGSNCSISAGVQIYSHDTVERSVSGGAAPVVREKTVIGSNCYIGPNVVIVKGTVIGDGVIIGANSLVLNNIPSFTKAFGSPCKIVEKL